ncbi:MAG: UTP--glucose-1-phosphate uridylyltransferase [Acidimicrobiales bacterium]
MPEEVDRTGPNVVRKAVIPAAGLGTRFLPASKVMPKEMLTVVDKPAIQYVVEEAVLAGIEDILIVTSPHKKTLEDHFDRAFELEARLVAKGKQAEAERVAALSELAQIHFVRQGEPLGLGHAVSIARRHVGDEPFAVLLPDDLMYDASKGPRADPATKQHAAVLSGMLAAYAERGASVVALRSVPMSEISAYGCAAAEPAPGSADLVRITGLVEKPAAEAAPSNLAVMGRYVFSPAVFTELERVRPGVGGEIQLTDAMHALLAGEGMYGFVFTEGRYDVGNKADYLRATVEFGLDHPELGAEFRSYLEDKVKRLADKSD